MLKTQFILLVGILSLGSIHAQSFEPANVDLSKYENRKPGGILEHYFNDQGMEAYDKKDYKLAAGLFYRAAQINPKYATAHYNLACVLALLKRENSNYPGLTDDDETIKAHLAQAIALDSKWRSHMQGDTDLTSIKNHYYFKLLSLDPKATVQDWLVAIPTWYGPQPGIFPPSPTVKFFKDGRVQFQTFTVPEMGTPAYAAPDWGRYTLIGKDLSITNLPGGALRGSVDWKIKDGLVDSLFIQVFNQDNEVLTLTISIDEGGV